jgi:hypothetical protein
MADITVPPLVIRELSGQKRELRLTDRSLPYRPMEIGVGQRVELTWLPGAPRATATVLGPTEDPTTMNGYWKEKYIAPFRPVPPAPRAGDSTLDKIQKGISAVASLDFASLSAAAPGPAPPDVRAPTAVLNGQAIVHVWDLVALVDDICRQGQLLEMTWHREVRQGFLKKFVKKWHTDFDVEWTMQFDWVGRNEPVGPLQISTVAGLDAMAAQFKAFEDRLLSLEVPKGGFLSALANALSKIQEVQQALEDAIGGVVDAVTGFTTGINSIVQASKGIAYTLESVIETGDLLIASVALLAVSAVTDWDFREPESETANLLMQALGTPTSSIVVDSRSEADKLNMASFVDQLTSVAQDARHFAAVARTELDNALGAGAASLGSQTVRSGQDLRDAAEDAYGSRDEWRRLMLYNETASVQVADDTELLVPPAQPGDTGVPC